MASLVAMYFGNDAIILLAYVMTWPTVDRRLVPIRVRMYPCMCRVRSC